MEELGLGPGLLIDQPSTCLLYFVRIKWLLLFWPQGIVRAADHLPLCKITASLLLMLILQPFFGGFILQTP